MDNNPTLARNQDSDLPPEASAARATSQSNIARALRFPAGEGSSSLAEMAKRDLAATLQLLAERAQYITGATGAAIALWENELMVCRASAGASAPELGSHLQVNSGLSAQSVRLRQVLRCDDAETDPRVNRESCRRLGIASVLVMPLIADSGVVGVFELFSDKPSAFSERDIEALERMSELIGTALAHADAARQVERAQEASRTEGAEADLTPAVPAEDAGGSEPADEEVILTVEAPSPPSGPKGVIIPIRHRPAAEPDLPKPILAGELGRIGRCEACGFPVSPGRSLCMDCESGKTPTAIAPRPAPVSIASASETPTAPQEVPGTDVPAFLAQYASEEAAGAGWLASHKLFLGSLALVAMLALLLWLAHSGILRLPS